MLQNSQTVYCDMTSTRNEGLHQLIMVGQENRFAKFKYSGLGCFLAYDLLVFM